MSIISILNSPGKKLHVKVSSRLAETGGTCQENRAKSPQSCLHLVMIGQVMSGNGSATHPAPI